MAPKAKLSTAGVVSRSISFVDELGYDALSVSAIANELGVASSALYTYCDSLDGLRNLVAIEATNNLVGDVRDAATGTAGTAALLAMGSAYRLFAVDHPGQFASMLRPPVVDNFDLANANKALLDVFVRVYQASGVEEEAATLAGQTTRIAIHGFLSLGHNAGTTGDQEVEFNRVLGAVIAGFA